MCAMADGEDLLIDEDGGELPGFLVPARDPSLVVVHEVFGLNQQIRGMARRYAAEGFTVFAMRLPNIHLDF
jgi:dienelactone hydrolase